MTDTILYDRRGRIGHLVLNNPERHNSLGQDELLAMQEHLTSIAQDQELRVLVVTGSGDQTFCAGASLQQLGAGQLRGDSFQKTTQQLAELPIPTIAALNGNIFGGGVELALSCDFRIGIEGSRMRVPAAAIGLCYPLSGIRLFYQRLGLTVSKRVLVASEEFDSASMLSIGFLDHLVPPSALQEKTMNLASHIADLAPLAVRAMKHILQQAAGEGVDEELAETLVEACKQSDDLREGLAAKREKREPKFQGR